jgi:hypothetical protein
MAAMSEPDDRFRSLDRIPAPDLWADANARAPGADPRGGRPRRAGALLSVVALVAIVAVLAILARGLSNPSPATSPPNVTPGGPGPTSSPGPHPPAQPRSVSGVSANGSVLCSATVSSTVVEPGDTLSVSFSIENLGQRPVQYSVGPSGDRGTVRLVDAGGTTVWDQERSQFVHSEPAPMPTELPPGATAAIGGTDVVMAWAGPLRVMTSCPFGVGDLDPVTLGVVAPGPAPSVADAIAAAVDASGGLYSQCAPAPDGSGSTGRIEPPDGSTSVLELPAVCWADVRSGTGLQVVTLHFSSPPEAGEVDVSPTSAVEFGRARPAEASTWEFVVTARGAVAATGLFSASSSGPQLWTVDYDEDGGHWSKAGCSAPGESVGSGVEFFTDRSCLGR